ncbi:hypothetical protein M8J76_012638 [Diaphorina citri]|nr:hypothetical protein M8J76_012638 [Diaphorina citri]
MNLTFRSLNSKNSKSRSMRRENTKKTSRIESAIQFGMIKAEDLWSVDVQTKDRTPINAQYVRYLDPLPDLTAWFNLETFSGQFVTSNLPPNYDHDLKKDLKSDLIGSPNLQY